MKKCTKCNNKISSVLRADGIPNGVGFVMEDGREITLCNDCIIKLGLLKQEQDEEGLNKFFAEIGVDA